jgi:nicotinamidase/pyrazinamidase
MCGEKPMARTMPIEAGDVFLVIDVQNDFCPGGLLPVPYGDDVVSPINRLANRFTHIVLTQDWHPHGHHSFASSHPGRKPYETIPHAELILRKGFRPEIDSYSAFFENDRETPTGLAGYLHERGFSRVFLAGLAFDYCVRYSAEDAQRQGFTAVIIEDACRAIGVADSVEAARLSFVEHGINTIEASVIP